MTITRPPRSEIHRVHEQLPTPVPRGEMISQWREVQKSGADFAGALWSKRWPIAGFTLFTTLAGIGYALTKQNSYVSEAVLMVTGSNATQSIAEASRSLLMGTTTGWLDTINASKIIASREVARHVVDRVGARRVLMPYRPIRDDDEGLGSQLIDVAHRLISKLRSADLPESVDKDEGMKAIAVERVAAGLWAVPEDQSTAVRVRFRASNPETAHRVLQAAAEAAVAQWENVMTPKASRQFLEEQLVNAKAEEKKAREALSAFLKKNGATDYGEDVRSLAAGLARAANEVELWEATVASNQKEITALEAELGKISPKIETSSSESDRTQSAVDTLRSEIAKVEADRAAAVAAGSGTKMLDARITALKDRIDSYKNESADKVKAVTMGPNPQYTSLQTTLASKKVELISIHAKLDDQKEYLRKGRERLESLRLLQGEADQLQERVRTWTESVRRLNDAVRSFDVNQEMSLRGITSLRVVEPANLPLSKEGPARGRVIVGGFVGGLFVALSFVIARMRWSKAMLRGEHARLSLMRTDIVASPWLDHQHVARFQEARAKGWE